MTDLADLVFQHKEFPAITVKKLNELRGYVEDVYAITTDPTVVAFAGLTGTVDTVPYFNGADTMALTSFTSWGRTLVATANAADTRATIGFDEAVDDRVAALITTISGLAAVYDDVANTLTLSIDDTQLVAMGNTTPAANEIIYFTGPSTASTTGLTAFGRSLIDDADAAAAQTTLGLVIGTNVQAQDAQLSAMAGLTPAADQIIYWTGATTAAMTGFTAAARSLTGQNAGDGNILYGLGGAWLQLSFVATPSRYIGNDASGFPAWMQVNLADGVTGDLPFANIQDITAQYRLLGRSSSGAGVIEEIASSANVFTMLGSADNAAIRTNIGLGTAALKNTGTSGDAVPLLNVANTWADVQTFSVDATISGRAVGTGGQTNAVVLGGTVSATAGTAVGSGSSAAGSGTAIGRLANAGTNALAIGTSAAATATNSLALGHSADAGGFASYVLGRASVSTAANQFVAGSDSTAITTVFFGRGVVSATVTNVVINGTGGSGTDIAGGNLTIAGGRNTGSATPGNVIFQTAAAGASGTTLRSLATRATITPSGVDIASGHVLLVNGTQVVGARGAAVADATDAATAITQLNALLARCRAHGLIA